ncbi:uncharacterized protein LOC113324627 [Papaver somniferum]|uniref:uncharacterized protein LOC113324627 n=1 Tax=Papaver somniferum TaxID=3469 RepID=UPI000E700FB0|nr:uncharacterized protein LOC113324627 [Papaver somniferum]
MFLKLWYILEDGLEAILAATDKDDDELKRRRKKREEDDFMCRGHILNVLGLNVYNAHRIYGTPKELWTALENKYKISEASNKKFLICNFMDWKMVDSKSIIAQFSDLLLIVNHLKDAGIDLRHLRIEEDARKREIKDSQQTENHSKINNVQESKTSNSLKVQNNSQFKKQDPNKNGKKKGLCYFCTKPDHIARDYRQKKKQMNKETNMVDDSKLVIVVQEANTVADHGSGWWYDTGATIHICKDRNLYKTYEPVFGEDVISENLLPRYMAKALLNSSLLLERLLPLPMYYMSQTYVKTLFLESLLTRQVSRLSLDMISLYCPKTESLLDKDTLVTEWINLI